VPIQTVFETGLLELPEHTLRILEAGYAFTLGHTSQSNRLYFEILWPERGDAVLSENEASVVILLTYDRFRALLTGDSGAVAERAILERSQPERIRCYLLKVGHHGSKGSSSDAFLSACQPVTAVIQSGANRYGHPHADVLTRLELAGARVMRTDVHGAVSIITDGWRVKVSGRLGQ